MKKLSLLLIGLLLAPTLMLTSCDRGDDPEDNNVVTTPKFELMKDYMVNNSLDINKILTNDAGQKFVKYITGTSTEAEAALENYYVMDIRAESDYLAAHVKGANHVPFSNILTAAESADKPILVVCYTGQSACYATALLRLYGYTDTQALKWGMSGWNSANAGPWNNNIGTVANGHSNWTYAAAPANVTYDDPVISTTLSSGELILKERVEAVVAGGFQGVGGSEVLANPSGYFINNYFSETDYLGFGHINGAVRVQPFVLADDTYKSLNPDASTVVTYCYTGQTSAVLSAVLNVLGYNAKSLTFGMNGMYNDNPSWSSNQWSSSVPHDYPVYSN